MYVFKLALQHLPHIAEQSPDVFSLSSEMRQVRKIGSGCFSQQTGKHERIRKSLFTCEKLDHGMETYCKNLRSVTRGGQS
jgi:hypothetical protein